MSDETLTTESTDGTETAEQPAVATKGIAAGRATRDEHGHLTDFGYVRIFIILAVITAIEVAFSYLPLPTPVFLIGLFIMMVVKFYLVAAEFMHLKGDHKYFTQFFVTGLVLAVGVYLIFLSASQLWQSFDF